MKERTFSLLVGIFNSMVATFLLGAFILNDSISINIRIITAVLFFFNFVFGIILIARGIR